MISVLDVGSGAPWYIDQLISHGSAAEQNIAQEAGSTPLTWRLYRMMTQLTGMPVPV